MQKYLINYALARFFANMPAKLRSMLLDWVANCYSWPAVNVPCRRHGLMQTGIGH
jgi:hypothetical protein